MQRLRTTATVFLSILGFSSLAHAGPWANFKTHALPQVSQTISMVTENPGPQVGAIATYQGRIVRFEVTYNEQSGALDCKADVSVETEPKGFTARLNFDLNLGEANPKTQVTLLRRTAGCLAAQRAYLRDQKVSVTGKIESLGRMLPRQLGVISVLGFSSMPNILAIPLGSESQPSSAPSEASNICTPIGCIAQGTVTRLAYDLGENSSLCTATLKIPQPDGSSQIAHLSVPFARYDDEYRWLPEAQAFQILHSKLQACQLLEASFDSDRPVKVTGAGQAANVRVNSLTLEEAPPPQMDPAF